MATVVRDEKLEEALQAIADDQLVEVSPNGVAKAILKRATSMGKAELARWLKNEPQGPAKQAGNVVTA